MDELTPEQIEELGRDLHVLRDALKAEMSESESKGEHDNHRSHVELRLRHATHAIAAIRESEYGFCTSCEEPIGYDRLKAKPEGQYCGACQDKLHPKHAS